MSVIQANCGNPLDQTLDNFTLLAIGYTIPALEGDSVIFSCPLGLAINGSNMSTCMENGKWEPDPKEVECKGELTYNLLSHDRPQSSYFY